MGVVGKIIVVAVLVIFAFIAGVVIGMDMEEKKGDKY